MSLPVKTWQSRINREATELKKDNDFIYHERIPASDCLEAIGRATLAKSLPLSKPASSSFVDLFSKLVPMAVHNALQAYESRKGEIINFEVGRLREGTQLMNRSVDQGVGILTLFLYSTVVHRSFSKAQNEI